MKNSNLQTVAARLRFLLAGEGFEGQSDDALALAAVKLDGEVQEILSRQAWDAASSEHGNTWGKPLDRFGSEVGYSGFYLRAPLELARAFCCPFSRFFRQNEILERLAASMEHFEPFIRSDTARQGNWYAWDIAIPRWLSQILVLCGEDLPGELREKLVSALNATPFMIFGADAEKGVWRNPDQPVGGGSNTMEVLLHLLWRAAATGDGRWADRAWEKVPIAMGISPDGEGVQSDWSFHFHGHGINATYGHICMATQAQWLFLTQNTPWQAQDSALEAHLGTMREFFTLNAWHGRFSVHTLDRAPSRPGGIYGEVAGFGCDYLTALLLSLESATDEPTRESLARAAKDWLESRQSEAALGIRPQLDLSANLLARRAAPFLEATTPEPNITRFYPSSDYLIARRKNWFLASLMSSTRTAGWKSILGEHAYGSSAPEFSLVLMTDGQEYTHDSVPTMNWQRLMGVTRCDSIENAPEGYGLSSFVGGLTGENCAVLAMQYLVSPPAQKTLRGNKSLLVTGDALILLGSGISCDGEEPVFTTLFHAPIFEGASYQVNGENLDFGSDQNRELQAGDTLFCRNTALKLLSPARLLVEERCASYKDMVAENVRSRPDLPPEYDETHRLRWIYLVAEHGVKPSAGIYGAVIYPGVEADFIIPNDLKIRHETNLHRVDDGKSGAEVRFPGDWHEIAGMSYLGAEPVKWGNLALWEPSNDPERLNLSLLPPMRFLRQPNRATEIFLPDGLFADDSKLPPVTLEGKPWPKNVFPCMANGEIIHLEVTRTDGN